MQLLQIAIAQNQLVPFPDAQILRNSGGQEHLILPGHGEPVIPLVEINESGKLVTAGKQIDFLYPVVKVQFYTALVIEHHVFGIPLYRLSELFLLPFRRLLPKIDGNIILCNIFKLIVHNIGNGIPQAKACQQQRRTAADANEHHGQPLPVAEDVSDGHLIQEADFLPERQPFHKDLLSRLRRLGADQFCRILCQSLMAAPPGDKEHDRRIDYQHRYGKRPVEG